MANPRYTMSTDVPAPPGKVWPALLASLKYVSDKARDQTLRSAGKQRMSVPLPEEDGGPSAGHVTVTADPTTRTVSIKGAWWYKGVWTIEPHGGGSRVRYDIYNAAFLPTRWVVPLVTGGVGKRLEEEFDKTLRRTTQRL
jgi:hypothetical protein